MLSRMCYLPRRCSCQLRFYSKEIENLQDQQLSDNEVKVNLNWSEAPSQSRTDHDSKSIDRKLQMRRLRNSFIKPGPGLRSCKNRDDLVAEFFELSKSVLGGQLTVAELKNSNTILDLEEQLNYHIDIMSNSQVINMVASLVKMRFEPSTKMLRLLEHEVKFRVNSLTLAQIMKLLRFYYSIETTYEQKQLIDILNNRLRSILLSNKTPLIELLEIYHHLVEQESRTNMLGLVEEKVLSNLVDVKSDEDDLVSRYLHKTASFSYELLCNVFIELASAKRRPTPLLKKASQKLFELPMPGEQDSRPTVTTLITTLNSLVSLNYTNRQLVGKLMNDLKEIIDLEQLNLTTQCNLMRIISSLKWRHASLLELFYDYAQNHKEDNKKVDHNYVLTLFHVTAHLNHKPERNIRVFFEECMQGSREALINPQSRKWLDYVWSLAVLDIATEEHLQSVLNDDFIRQIESPTGQQQVNYADKMKLLNLRALAAVGNRSVPDNSKLLDEFAAIEAQRGADYQKFASKIKDALIGIVKASENLPNETQTPFGFAVDCGLRLGSNSELEAIDSLSLKTDLKTTTGKVCDSHAKVALIYVLFDETLASHPNEPVGRKKITAKILDRIGYRTTFVQEVIINRYKTSADLAAGLLKAVKEVALEKNDTNLIT